MSFRTHTAIMGEKLTKFDVHSGSKTYWGLLLVVQSCNTFAATMGKLYTYGLGGLAWARCPGPAVESLDFYIVNLK